MTGTSRAAQASHAVRKGLTTIALLKAQYDAGTDYFEMFMPFLTESIWALPEDDFDVKRVRDEIGDRFGLILPLETLHTLLRRAAKRDLIHKAGGRHFRNAEKHREPEIPAARREIEREITALAGGLVSYALEHGGHRLTEEDALAWLFAFLSDNQVQLLLDDDTSQLELSTGLLNFKRTRIVARYISEVCLRDPALARYLQSAVTGLVLQSTLLLRDITPTRATFGNLQAYFDSGFLFGALGYQGTARQLSNRETVEVLKSAGVIVRAFDKTVQEMKRILGVYEAHLATPDGKAQLRPTDLTRFFLTNRYTPADVRQEISLLERTLQAAGIEVVALPARNARYTIDEQSLASLLKGPQEKAEGPRVLHDVDCVASVMTLRRNAQPTKLEEAKAVFATTSMHVLRSVGKWFDGSGLSGVSPIIHLTSLANAAWMKRPASASMLPVHELAALCAAALRPTKETWSQFLAHLKRLETNGLISDDEAVAVIVSGLTDQALAEAEEEGDLDADTLTEVVERVRASYQEEAQAAITAHKIETQEALDRERDRAHTAERAVQELEAARGMDAKLLDKRLLQIASAVGTSVFVIVGILVAGGVLFLLPDVFRPVSSLLGVSTWVFVFAAAVITVLGLVYGIHVGHLRSRVRDRSYDALRGWFGRGAE